MAIDYRLAKAILQEHKYKPITGTILLIGRQSVTLTPVQAEELVEAEGLHVRADASRDVDTQTWGVAGRSFITDSAFFSLFSDAKVISLDVSDYEGCAIVADLNQPVDTKYYECADFIFNGSCMDNLFDPASALKNMSRLLKSGGRVMHIEHGSPIQSAYIMYSPAYFFDYYAANHFADCKNYALFFDHILDAWNVFHWEGYAMKDDAWALTEHMHPKWQNILNLVIAEKGEESTADATPIQGFYRQVHGTEHDTYFNAFKRFRNSKRPLLKPDVKIKKDGQPLPGYTLLGTWEEPQFRQNRLALAELETARACRVKGKTELAIEAFSRAIEHCDTIGMPGLIYVERGDMYAQLGEHSKALADYKRAVTMNPQEASFCQRMESSAQKSPALTKRKFWEKRSA